MYEAYSAVSSLFYTALLAVTSPNDNLPEIRTSLNVSPRKEVKTCGEQCQRAVLDKDKKLELGKWKYNCYYTHVYTRGHISLVTRPCTHTTDLHTYHKHTYLHTYIYTDIHTYIYISTYIIHTYIHTYTQYIHTYTYMHTYTRTYTHTYIHTFIYAHNIHLHTKAIKHKSIPRPKYIIHTYIHACVGQQINIHT